MDLKQSFILSVCRSRLTLYEQRIMLAIIEHGQRVLDGLFLQEHLEHIPHSFKHEQIAIPARYLMPDGSQHYEHVYDAARAMVNRQIEYFDTEKKKWAFSPIIFDVVCADGTLSFFVSNLFWDVLFDFSRGFSWYDLEIAMSLPSPYAVRMYMMLCSNKRPIKYAVESLKEMFCVQDKYAQTADFIKKVIEPSKIALDKAGGNTFTYARIKTGQKVTHLEFFPVTKQNLTHVPADPSLYWAALSHKEISIRLIQECGFTHKQLSYHEQLLKLLASHPMASDILSQVIHRWRKKGAGKGYIISALRSELNVASTKVK